MPTMMFSLVFCSTRRNGQNQAAGYTFHRGTGSAHGDHCSTLRFTASFLHQGTFNQRAGVGAQVAAGSCLPGRSPPLWTVSKIQQAETATDVSGTVDVEQNQQVQQAWS